MNLNHQSATIQRPRGRSRVLLASIAAAAALTGQLIALAPAASADGPKPTGHQNEKSVEGKKHGLSEHDKHKKHGPQVIHGLRQFTSDNTFTPPPGVTSVFVQAWGAGGGGGGGGGSARNNGGGGNPNNPNNTNNPTGGVDGAADADAAAAARNTGGHGGGGGGGGFTWCVIPVTPWRTTAWTSAPEAPTASAEPRVPTAPPAPRAPPRR